MNSEARDVESREGLDERPVKGDLRSFVVWFFCEIRWLMRVLVSSADRFYWDNGFSKAAALAYTTLLSLVPLTSLCFGIVASFAVSEEYVARVKRFLFNQFIPNTQTVESVIRYLEEFSSTVTGLNHLMVAFLLVTSLLLINSVEYALNQTWQVFEVRSITKRLQTFCAIILIAPVLAISAYSFTSYRIDPYVTSLSRSVTEWYVFVSQFLVDCAAFVSLYYLVPNAPVRFRSAVFGGFFAALLFSCAKRGFAIYVEQFASYQVFYGATIAAIPIFLLWMYLGWTVVLFGCECSYQAQYLPTSGKLFKRSLLSVGDAQVHLAVQALITVEQAFSRGTRLPNDLDLAEALGCSSMVIRPALAAMERAGLVAHGDSRDMPLTFLRDPSQITLGDILRAVFPNQAKMYYPRTMAKFYDLATHGADLNSVTLADVIAAGAKEKE